MTEESARTLVAALEEYIVAVVSNEGHGASAEGYLRFSDARDVLVGVLMETGAPA